MSGSSSHSRKGVPVLLIALTLLSLPAVAGGECPGPGTPDGGPGDPCMARGRDGGGAGARFNGSLSTVIEFPFTGGSDESLRLSLPGGSLVLNATLRLDGRSALPPATDRPVTFADAGNSSGWSGVSTNTPPSGGPSNYQSTQLDGQDRSYISKQDGSVLQTVTLSYGSPYHLFRFKVTEDVVNSLSVKYVGAGYDHLFMCTELKLYIYNSGRWSNIGTTSSFGADTSLVTFKKTISSPAGYVDSAGYVHILAMGPDGWFFSFLDTDYIELTVKGSSYAWPTDLALDIGSDGTTELEFPGQLKGLQEVGSDALAGPLQALIDRAGGAAAEVPLRLISRTGGVLSVKGLVEIDLPPALQPVPEVFIDEDVPGWARVDLDRYCQDDRDARPRYDVAPADPDGEVECRLNASGHHLDFRPTTPNWNGRREFVLRATDSSGLSSSVFLNVTVRPVNDPPVIHQVPDQTAYEDQPFTIIFRAYDVDDPADNLTFSDDFPPADVGERSGALSFTPTNGQVGRYGVNVTVTDPSGATATMAFNLVVENVNDPPVLECEEYLFATEDERFTYEPSAFDQDASDGLNFTLGCDIEGLEADRRTGEISFVFRNEHVGEHHLELVVTDRAGATDSRDILLTVENVNDPPEMEAGRELLAVEDEEFDYPVNAQDLDPGDRLSFSTDSELVRIDERTGVIRLTPGNDDVGRHRFTVTVTDRSGSTARASYTLIVKNVNDPPGNITILAPRNGAVVREGEPILFSATAIDPDADDLLVYVWKEDGRVLGRGPNLTARLRPGRHIITLEVSDGTVNGTAFVELTVQGSSAGQSGLLGALGAAALPLALVAAVVVATAALSLRRRKGPDNKAGPGNPPGPYGWPPQSPGAPPPPAVADRRPPPQGPQWSPMPAQQPPAGPGQAPGYYAAQPPAGPWPPPANPPARPLAGPWPPPGLGAPGQMAGPNEPNGPPPPPHMDRPPREQPYAQSTATQPWAPPRPADMEAAPPRENRGHPAAPRADAQPSDDEPPHAIPLDDAVPEDRSGGAWPVPTPPGGPRPAGHLPPGEPPGERRHPAGPERPPGARRRRGDESVVTRADMRAAINDARHALSAARAAGLNPSDGERLLSEAVAASYRQEYARSRDLARRCESATLSMLEGAAREEERRGGGPLDGPGAKPLEDGAEEAA